MIDFNGKHIFFLSPHTDDAELGCGGTIAHCIAAGGIPYVIAFSYCDMMELRTEFMDSMKVLGVQESNVRILIYQSRHFHESRQAILQEMIDGFRFEIQPDMIFCPSPHDIHQDHRTITEETIRAYKRKTIFAYEMPWNNMNFNTSVFVRLSVDEVKTKIEAATKYRSQSHRAYMNAEAIQAQAIMRGTQIGVKFAEAFEPIRIIV